MRELKVVINGCHRIATLIMFLLVFGVASAQQFALPCKKYPASVPFKCDIAVSGYWHVTSVKCLGPSGRGYKFRISGRALKSHRSQTGYLLYIGLGNKHLSNAGSFTFPTVVEGKLFSFDVILGTVGRSPFRFDGFMIVNRPMPNTSQQGRKVTQKSTVKFVPPVINKESETKEELVENPNKANTHIGSFDVQGNGGGNSSNSNKVVEKPENDKKVYDVVEVMPSFPGGHFALVNWISTNMKYPVVAEENGVQGRVTLTFIIERDGSIGDVRVVNSVDPSLDKEAIRLIKTMPRWNPGTQNGDPVRVKFTMPLTFRIQ